MIISLRKATSRSPRWVNLGVRWVSWRSSCSLRRSANPQAISTEQRRLTPTSFLGAARCARAKTPRNRKELMSLTWSALPIAPNEDFDGAPLLRTEFVLEEGHGSVARATLHATAHGIFEGYLNGQLVSDDILSPGWTSYEWRLRYCSYDVTSLLQPTSVLGIALGNGWFRGRLGWSGGRALYGDELAALAQLEIEFTDGHRQTIITDDGWTAGPSAVVFNDLYDGETIDARRQSDAWLQPDFSKKEWTG